jgi:hypothetical protein
MLVATPLLDSDKEAKNLPRRMRGETETEFLERDPVLMDTIRRDQAGTLKWYSFPEEDLEEFFNASERDDRETVKKIRERILAQ